MNKFIVPLIVGLALAFSCFQVFDTTSSDSLKFTENSETPAYLGETFKLWMKRFNKSYTSEAEFKHRLGIFIKNYTALPELRKPRTHKVGLTIFSDLTKEEFLIKYGGQFSPKDAIPSTFKTPNPKDRLASATITPVDHRNKLVGIKDQSSCGACWAFATNAGLEYAFNTVNSVPSDSLASLSEQELVDCTSPTTGCQGGAMELAIQYVMGSGVSSEASYPYIINNGQCDLTGRPRVVASQDILNYIRIPTGDGVSLERAVADSVVQITVDATDLFTYVGGVIKSASYTQVNHAVAIVGYGTDSGTGVDYYSVRNSWGTWWGEEGYFRVIREPLVPGLGVLGIRYTPYYPILQKHQE